MPGSRAVAVAYRAEEDPGPATAQGRRVQARPLDGLPGRFQCEALLRVHRQRLTRRDAEELRVELGCLVQESAVPGVGGAGTVRVGVVQCVHVPAATGRPERDRVTAPVEQFPQPFGCVGTAGEAAAHGDNGDRLVSGVLGLPQLPPRVAEVGGGAPEVVEQLLVVGHLCQLSLRRG